MALQLKHSVLLKNNLTLLAGQWVAADSGETIPVTNPANGLVFAQVPLMGQIETKRAIVAAELAQKSWKTHTAAARSAILKRWFDLIILHTEDLAQLLTAEQGKPLAEARGEVNYAASFIEWFSEEAKRVYGEVIPSPMTDRRLLVLKQPVGVTAAITPWNFPIAMITRKAAPALAAGCSMIIKPAEQTPLCAIALAVLAEEAGVPAGVLQVITGDARKIGAALCESPVVTKLSFTGSTEVGRILMRQCADTIKKLSLELGGNAPFIVFDDADLDAAVEGAMISKYRNAGQTCVCSNRLFVQDAVFDEFSKKLTAKVAQLKVGVGSEEGVTQGPLIDDAAIAKVESHVADALAKGATLMQGGKRHALGGTFFEPTVLANVSADALIFSEETFGPVAPLFRFKTDDEVIELANRTEFGLASYFFSRDIGRIWRVAEALEYGMVGVNTGMISNEVAPFGGVKQSGLGREGSHHGIDEYLELKYVCMA
ncbi:MAG: NAD-dependent succinate-semialdehyde dehydrogenase, partial [Methylotenera sp.]|nr:NAD-dependent succinate-semialdehyde dehydrogenase [Methylotenera sp.]